MILDRFCVNLNGETVADVRGKYKNYKNISKSIKTCEHDESDIFWTKIGQHMNETIFDKNLDSRSGWYAPATGSAIHYRGKLGY